MLGMPIQRVSQADDALPIHDVAATRRIETRALALLCDRNGATTTDAALTRNDQTTAHEPSMLMRRAGLTVARLLLAVQPQAMHIVVAVGPGNNGGDGLLAAAHLRGAGKQVTAVLTKDAAALPADAHAALALAQDGGVVIRSSWPDTPCDAIIDALLGIGDARLPQDSLAQTWRDMHRCPAPMLAVDVPSGLDADRGIERFQNLPSRTAAHTVSLLTLKPGLFTGVGRDLCGTLWLDCLGVMSLDEAPIAWLGIDALHLGIRPRLHGTHKGSFGDVAMVGGASGMQGALVLACMSALAAGGGRIYAVPLQAPGAANDGATFAAAMAASTPEIMLRPDTQLQQRAWLNTKVIVCGCGAGDAVRDVLPPLLSGAPRLLLDADALNAIASDVKLQRLLTARHARGFATVLTPHPLEAARLLGMPDAQGVQADRLRVAQQLADQFACVVALKGAGTIVAARAQPPVINPTGNGLLATAGTGDVLAGWIGGQWAQQGALALPALRDLVTAAVWHHGAAADAVSATGTPRSLSASALIAAMIR